MGSATKLKAIDLYSGVGGWSLGLRLAGIDVVSSYERWGAANETNFKNNHHQAQTVDIRRLSVEELPSGIDIVVGSPPCTQFSFANRGGGGDIDDGLQDIIHFLTIVDHLKPSAWMMENVPRVAKIIEEELQPDGRLSQFAHLGVAIHVINMEEYGLPQRRRRCIAGNFDFALLESYKVKTTSRTLGNVIESLAGDPVVDPVYGTELTRDQLHDHVLEDALNEEEQRINRAAKLTHPVYNSMVFPDRLERSVRTINATCTRVSRESIVVQDSRSPGYRRLTVRERASLQGFPIHFQFYGDNYSQKLKMVGNAIPPLFAFYLAHALRGTKAGRLPDIQKAAKNLQLATPAPRDTPPDRSGFSYRPNRNFRFAIPSLQLKSGVRFEFRNRFVGVQASWEVGFYFGTSKSIQSLRLDSGLYTRIVALLPKKITKAVEEQLRRLADYIRQADIQHMQSIWSHSGPGRTRPFMMLDELDEVGKAVAVALHPYQEVSRSVVEAAINAEYGETSGDLLGMGKITRAAPVTLAGLLVGSLTNQELATHAPPLVQRTKAVHS